MSFIKQLLTSKDNLSKMSTLYQCSTYFRTNADLLIKKSINFLCEKNAVDEIFRANVKEHAPLSARASVEHRLRDETTGNHRN